MRLPLQPPLVHRWSTQDVPTNQRFDYYAGALESALIPMQIAQRPSVEFVAEMDMSDLGGLSVVRQRGSAHRCFTDARDLARSRERSFHLLLNVSSPWNIEHLGRSRMAPGDTLLTDSQIAWDIETPGDYDFVNLKLSEGWMRQWLPAPSALVGRRIGARSNWGHALAAFIAPLCPRVLQHSPLPVSLIADHVGSLLSLAVQEMSAMPPAPTRADKALHDRIKDCMQQLCASPSLTASEVATAIGVPLRTFYRSFSRFGETFGETLVGMRYTHALRMLDSPLFRRLTIAEIARRAGFCDASHFCRVVRSRSGCTPSQMRRHALASSRALLRPEAEEC